MVSLLAFLLAGRTEYMRVALTSLVLASELRLSGNTSSSFHGVKQLVIASLRKRRCRTSCHVDGILFESLFNVKAVVVGWVQIKVRHECPNLVTGRATMKRGWKLEQREKEAD